MPGAFNVTPEFVRQAGQDCDTAAGDVMVQLDTLRKYVTDLVGVADVANGAADAYQWMGVTAQQFGVLMENVHTYSVAMHNALIEIGNGLRQNYVNYVDVEADNNSGIESIANNLVTSFPPLNV